jgi:phosphoglycerate dehydrogenase-like enzyme
MSEKFVVALISCVHEVPEWVYDKYREAGVEFRYHECGTREDLQKYASDADVLWFMSSRTGLVSKENMDIFKKAGVVIKCGSGTDNIDHDACTKAGIIVAHTPEDPVEPTSDHAIALLFTAVRQTARQDRLIRRGIHEPQAALPIGKFTGEDLGIIGFGRIGKAIARKLAGFKMKVRVYDPYLDKAFVETLGAQKVELDELLHKSKYIIVQCPLTQETKNLLGRNQLQMMRPDSILVNNARAGIVDEKALIEALKNGWIKAAACDVLDNHDDKELLSLENLNFTPHLGGWPANYPYDTFAAVVNEIVGMSKKKKPQWIANPKVKPKWEWCNGSCTTVRT